MKKLEGFLILSGAMLLLIFLWISLLFNPTDSTEDQIASYIPMDATTIIKLNNQSIIRQLADEFLQNKENESTIKQLLDRRKDGSRKDLGLNISGPIYYFATPTNQAVLFELVNPEKWDKADFGSAFLKTRINNVGILQFSKDSPIKLLQSKISKAHNESEALVTIQLKNVLNCNISLENNSFNFKGESHISPQKINVLKPEGFHISSSVVPSHLNDSISKWTNGAIESIKSISFNYLGTSIKQDGRIIVQPDCQLILESSSPIHIADLIESSLFFHQFKWTQVDSSTFESDYYELKLIQPNVLFLDNKSRQSKIKQKLVVFEMNGQPKSLTKLSGDPTIAGIISLFPAYSIPNNIFLEIKSCDVAISNGKIDGSIAFQKGKQPLLVILEQVLKQ